MRFEEVYESWMGSRLTQEEAAKILGVSDRTFRRYIERYEEDGLEGLIDKRLNQVSHLRAPVDEVLRLSTLYQKSYRGWNVKHFYSFYRRQHKGRRCYTWVKETLQKSGIVKRAKKRGAHRRKRERAAMEGMMLHQDGSTHEWVKGQRWDLIVTMDDATSEHYSMFFVEEEGTGSSFRGLQETIEKKGLPCSLYTDRGSHYWFTKEAGGKVDKVNLTQFGRGMQQLGIEMIAAYSPEARGRSERAFGTHQGRLPKELEARGISTIEQANKYLKKVYMKNFNAEFAVKASCENSAFVPWVGGNLEDILCEQHERVVGKDNCVSFHGLALQIPKDQYRCHYLKVKVRLHCYANGEIAIFHGPRKLGQYGTKGELIVKKLQKKAA